MLQVIAKPEYSVYSTHKCAAWCQVSVRAADVPPGLDSEKRAPASLTVVLDRSMDGQKLKLAKQTITFLLEQLRAEDRVGVVSFDDEVKEEAALSSATADHCHKADAAVAILCGGGSANLLAGLLKGLHQQVALPWQNSESHRALEDFVTEESLSSATDNVLTVTVGGAMKAINEASPVASDQGSEEASSKQEQKGLRACFLLSDGRIDRGITDQGRLMLALKTFLARAEKRDAGGLSISTFAFGNDRDQDMLVAIAGEAGGTHHYIKNADDIPGAFAEALGGLRSVSAQTVEVQLTPKNGASIIKVHSGFPTRAAGESTIVSIPDIYVEDAKSLLAELSLPKSADGGVQDYVDVSVAYFNMGRAAYESASTEFAVDRAGDVSKEASADEEIVAQRMRLSTAAALEDAMRLAGEGHLDDAQRCLLRQQQFLENTVVGDPAARAAQRALRYDVAATLQVFSADTAYTEAQGRRFAVTTSLSHKIHKNERSNVFSKVLNSPAPWQGKTPESRRSPWNIQHAKSRSWRRSKVVPTEFEGQAEAPRLQKRWSEKWRSVVKTLFSQKSSQEPQEWNKNEAAAATSRAQRLYLKRYRDRALLPMSAISERSGDVVPSESGRVRSKSLPLWQSVPLRQSSLR